MRNWPTTGIQISGGIKQQSTAGKSSGNGMIYLRCFCLFLSMMGMLLTIKEAFRLDADLKMILSVLAVYCLLLGAVQIHGGKWQLLWYGWNTVIALAGGFRWKQALSGYFAVENGVRLRLSEYYKMNLARRKLPVEEESGELFLFLVLTILIAALGRLVVRKGRTALLALVQALVFSLELLCGCTFQGVGIYLVMCSVLVLTVMGNRFGGRSQRAVFHAGIWAGGLILALALAAGTVLGPIAFEKTQMLNQKLYDVIDKTTARISGALSSQNGLFGDHTPTADGSLNNYGVDQDEETDLKITVSEKPTGSMYLRGFIGDTYERTYWHRIDRDTFEQAFPGKDAAYQVQNILYRYIEKQADDPKGAVEVERIRPGGDYGYVPYGFEAPNDLNLEGDSYYSSAEERMEYSGYVNWKKWVGDEPALEEESETERKYRDYVADQYLKIPVEGLERLKEYCGQQEFHTVQDVIDFVVPTVKEGRPYSMDLEPVPEGKDFAEYFFFEQKKGYCIHYATTAVLMFRMLGVPARYATGYVVAPEAFLETENGFAAEVPDSQAHAWAEVYRSGKGWIPIEVTPGYEDNREEGGMIAEDLPGSFTDNSPEENIPVTPEPVQGQTEPMQGQTESMQGQAEPTPEQTEPAPGENGIQPQNPENAEGKDSESGSHLRRTTEALSRIFVILFAAAALVGLCIFGIQVNRRRVLKKRYRKFMQKDRNKAVCEISYGLYQMLWDAGIQEPDTGDVDYARKMEKALGILENGEYVKFIQLVQRAAYGSEQLTKEHHDACLEFYHRIAGYLWQQMTKRKKFRWKYMKCYEIS